ncbi:MAG: hypothetical protein WDO73_21440 [Ignavibacteriota bacterium]
MTAIVMTGVDKLAEGTPVTVAMADPNTAKPSGTSGSKSGRKEEVSPSRTLFSARSQLPF